jgi:Mg/Co/Ni transporter MgtE
VYVKYDAVSSISIACTMFVIVSLATTIGAALPLGMHRMGMDPAHGGPAIQVVMDIGGVLLTCIICSLFLAGHPADPS